MTRKRPLGKRVLCLLFAVTCILAAVCPAFAAGEAATDLMNDSTYTAKIHNRASSGATVIGQMENNARIEVLSQSGDFYRIDCYGMTGYIACHQVLAGEDGEYYVNCKRDSAETQLLQYETQEDAEVIRQSVYALAKRQLGYPYVYGGARPGGFDCSGLTMYLYANHGYSIHRTASQQLQDGIAVAKDALEVGDLVFFKTTYETYPASHVGVYVGDGKIIHAGSKGIVYADLDGSWFRDYYLCARRLVNTSRTGITETPAVNVQTALTYRRNTGSLRTSGI